MEDMIKPQVPPSEEQQGQRRQAWIQNEKKKKSPEGMGTPTTIKLSQVGICYS
jgi:hypothetical protein